MIITIVVEYWYVKYIDKHINLQLNFLGFWLGIIDWISISKRTLFEMDKRIQMYTIKQIKYSSSH